MQPGVICSQLLRGSVATDISFDGIYDNGGYHCKSNDYREYNDTGAVGDQCNEFYFGKFTTAPWPKDCRMYHLNEFDNYEISRDGKSVDSCNVTSDEVNKPNPALDYPKCVEYYEKDYMSELKDGTKLMYPDTGEQCYFREARYPVKPWQDWTKWPHGCKIWQAEDPCSSYEISDDGAYPISCDIAMKKGVCISNGKSHFCLKECDPGGCAKKDDEGNAFAI